MHLAIGNNILHTPGKEYVLRVGKKVFNIVSMTYDANDSCVCGLSDGSHITAAFGAEINAIIEINGKKFPLKKLINTRGTK